MLAGVGFIHVADLLAGDKGGSESQSSSSLFREIKDPVSPNALHMKVGDEEGGQRGVGRGDGSNPLTIMSFP